MSNFRTKIFGLAAVATAFAGVSYGQTITCGATTTSTPLNPSLRAESQTELVADVNTVGCATRTAAAAPTTDTGSVYATLSLPVTSKALTAAQATGAGSAGNSETTLTVTDTDAATSKVYYGTVTGNQISFNGVTYPANFTISVQNVRVNASGGGAPQVTESVLVSYASVGATGVTVTANLPLPAQNVGYVLQSLSATTNLAPAGAYLTCTGNVYSNLPAAAAATPSFTLVVKELFGGAFKTLAGEGGSNVIPASTAGVATTATQLLVTLANIPAAATVYLPQTITTNGQVLTLNNTTAASGPTSIIAYNTANAAVYGPEVALTPTNNGVAATYTVTTQNPTGGTTTFNIPVFVNIPTNTAVQSAMTALVSYTPTGTVSGPAAAIPTFLATTNTAVSEQTINTCATNLLFTFTTNQLGFDTGLVIANTSQDTLGTGGKSAAANQSGTCTLNFFGNGAPTPATGVADPGGNLAAGATHAFTLSSVAPGFQGYVIAACPFQYAHGFAFITYNLTQNNGVAEGYLAEVLTGRPTAGAAVEGITF